MLSSVFLPDSQALFAMIVVGGAVASVVLVALVLGHAWIAAASHPALVGRHWLGTQQAAYKWGTVYSFASALAVLAGGVVYFVGVRVALSTGATHVFVGAGIVLAVAGCIASVFRTCTPQTVSTIP